MTKAAEVFSVNDRVMNPTYGSGTISQVDSHYTTIAFDEHGTKKFLTSMVKLEHSSTPAPAKPARAKKAKSTKTATATKTPKAPKAPKVPKVPKVPKAAKAAKAAK